MCIVHESCPSIVVYFVWDIKMLGLEHRPRTRYCVKGITRLNPNTLRDTRNQLRLIKKINQHPEQPGYPLPTGQISSTICRRHKTPGKQQLQQHHQRAKSQHHSGKGDQKIQETEQEPIVQAPQKKQPFSLQAPTTKKKKEKRTCTPQIKTQKAQQ